MLFLYFWLAAVWFPGLHAAVRSSVKNVPISHQTAVSGEPTYLPCDISTNDEEDSVVLVLWYREDLGTPIYSVDARERDFSIAERWSDESVFGMRAYFLPERKPAELGVDRVKASDQGVYRCRVDFRRAQTRNSRVNLTVVVPAQKIVITDENGEKKQAIVGPYLEGDSFMLRCDVYGGNPRPWVKWFRDETEVDTAGSLLPDGGVRGVLRVTKLSRADVRRTVTCKATNHARVHPIETTLMIDMNFPPLSVEVIGLNQPLSAAKRYNLLCHSSGSRPPASITWWKNGKRLNNAKETLSSDGNTTTSTIAFVAHQNDTGARLACRANNPAVTLAAPLEDGWTLDIQYVPEPMVRLGTNLDPANIREGSDVYFDCIMKAHPNVYRTEWRHNGSPLQHNVPKGIIISNQSLVLQGVGRQTGGNYTCVGFNAEGEGESPPFNLNVLFAPTCSNGQQRVYGVAKKEKAHVMCHVDSNPPEVQFRWTFNNTSNNVEVGPGHISRTGTSSTVTYTPLTVMDYGTLLCWGTNRIGAQKTPCVYHIMAAGKPDPVQNCSVVNASLTSFEIRCNEGFNGGVSQTFLLEVKELNSQAPSVNITKPDPRFTLVNMKPGQSYICIVRAFNSKGLSEAVVVRASTLRPPEKRHTLDQETESSRSLFPMFSTLPLAIGIGTASVLVCILLTLILRQKRAKSKPNTMAPAKEQNCMEKPWQEESDMDDRNPDLIPSDGEVEYIRRCQQVSTISPLRTPGGTTMSRIPPDGHCSGREYVYGGSIAGVRGYTTLRPQRELNYNQATALNIPPPARFASGSCTLPRNPSNGIHHQAHQNTQPLLDAIPRSATTLPPINDEDRKYNHEYARVSFPPALEELRPLRESFEKASYSLVRFDPMQRRDSLTQCPKSCSANSPALLMQSLRSAPVGSSPPSRTIVESSPPPHDTPL